MGVYSTRSLKYQKIRLREGKFHPGLQNKVNWTEFNVPIWPDRDTSGKNRDVVLWEDVLLFVPTAKKQLLLNNADLGFCRGTDREEQRPIRFEARPEDVIDVIGA
ncbi:hypothetical protein BGX24_007248 [Mortierella sp. AD032]|nr:hypothetical protein BGX24_007248 [Mortierella sp. AD032]